MQELDHLDVTHSIDLRDPQVVCRAVLELLVKENAQIDQGLITQAFEMFASLYAGTLPGYHGCETLYHDMQHALDVTLACARMLAGHERQHTTDERLGSERLTLGVIIALFHDAGYIRRRQDRRCWHGAQYTLHHVARGGRLLSQFLTQQGHGELARRAVKLIHFTGYEIPLDKIRVDNALDQRLGHLIGTADLIAQMSDRVYLEKCRDYLFEEFELGGLTKKQRVDGSIEVLYTSSWDLLRKTPAFYNSMIKKRLDADFQSSYRFLNLLFDGANPYMAAIERNMQYLQQILDEDRLQELLRRQPEPILTPATGKI